MSRKTTLPAGKYYIGDPCYVIDHEKWKEFLQPFWELTDPGRGGVFDFDGYQCATFYTRYGDGAYKLEPSGGYLPVDAGCIGCIPLALMVEGSEDGGAIVEFDRAFECYEDDGAIYYGDYVIRTGDDGRNYDADDDDYCSECGR